MVARGNRGVFGMKKLHVNVGTIGHMDHGKTTLPKCNDTRWGGQFVTFARRNSGRELSLVEPSRQTLWPRSAPSNKSGSLRRLKPCRMASGGRKSKRHRPTLRQSLRSLRRPAEQPPHSNPHSGVRRRFSSSES